jgi:fibrillarin-like rRNA methylase
MCLDRTLIFGVAYQIRSQRETIEGAKPRLNISPINNDGIPFIRY